LLSEVVLRFPVGFFLLILPREVPFTGAGFPVVARGFLRTVVHRLCAVESFSPSLASCGLPHVPPPSLPRVHALVGWVRGRFGVHTCCVQ